jgi:simple sugar transport system permease protein
MPGMSADLATALAGSMVTMAVPLLLPALGELIAERAGIINIGLEGLVLGGAFIALVCAMFSGSTALGIVAAVAAGAVLGAGLAFFVVGRNANQVVAGTAVNLLAVGLTGVAYRAIFGVTGAALTIPGSEPIGVPFLDALPIVGSAFFTQTPLAYAAFVLVPCVAVLLGRTVPGLKLRMVGENPQAAEAEGVDVRRTRTAALVLCGMLASAGGAYLAVAYAKTFVEGMSAGRGFIALAIVIVGRRSAWGILVAALLFGFVTALQFHFQALALPVPFQFFLVLPYVLTLVVLALSTGRAAAPAALGQPYRR